jgi:hypothetical protein
VLAESRKPMGYRDGEPRENSRHGSPSSVDDASGGYLPLIAAGGASIQNRFCTRRLIRQPPGVRTTVCS